MCVIVRVEMNKVDVAICVGLRVEREFEYIFFQIQYIIEISSQ